MGDLATAKDLFGYDSPEFRAEGITLRQPKLFGGSLTIEGNSLRLGWVWGWYWLIAGKQFCCSFEGLKGGPESRRALEALVRYVKDSLPEPVKDPASVVGPCCVPEGGDFPKPMPREKSDG